MSTQTVQLRVTLPAELQAFLLAKANRFGLNMSAYVKNLIINDVKDSEYPVKQASAKTEKAYTNALAERNDAVVIEDVGAYFDTL